MQGSGKSTLSRAIVGEWPTFTRISIDAILADLHGICGVDYPPAKYAEYQEEADRVCSGIFKHLLGRQTDIVLDRSFYAKADRNEYKAMIEKGGGRWVLVYLKADRHLLWRRICNRRAKGVNADSALDISAELLEQYVVGFEEPKGEGEQVIDIL